MLETIHERVDFLVKTFANDNNSVFARMVGSNEANVRGYRSKIVPKPDFLAKCVEALAISSDWLLLGRGELPGSGKLANETLPTRDLPHFVGSPDPGVLPEGAKLVPFYDVDFMGGFGELENDQTVRPDDWVVSPGFERATLWCRCVGRSMEPMICNGDLIALRHCRLEDVQYGSVYAVVLDTIRTIKVLRRSATPDRTLLFVPVNRQEYDEQEFPLDRIRQVFEVLGCTHYLGQ